MNNAIRALAVSGNSLFAGGDFTIANLGGTGATPVISANHVAEFDTTASTWSPLSQADHNGVSNTVHALAVSGNAIYVGGDFSFAGNVAANRVAKFDTTTNTWSALTQGDGNGVNSSVLALAVSGNSLFVGGFFTTANLGGTGATPAITANRVAKFDTTTNTWSALKQGDGNGVGNSMNDLVAALAVSGNSLFVGGSFTTVNQGGTGATPAITANNVAKFDTTTNTWSALSQGNGNGVNHVVVALAASGNSLFAGGQLTTANLGGTGATPAITANNVAKFDITTNTWSALKQGNGNGVDSTVDVLTVSGNSLFVGGDLQTANLGGTGATPAINANRVAKFDTTTNTWSALSQGNGNGVIGDVFALAVSGNSLFVGGGFGAANLGGTGATPAIGASNVAKFDTTTNTWSALAGSGGGNGVSSNVFDSRASVGALAVKDCDLFVGGAFIFADNKMSQNIARYGPPNPAPTPGQLLNISTRLRVLTDDNVLIGGFIITGTDPKKVIIRGIGPSLINVGVQGFLADPTLELHDASSTLATNDNWKTRPDGSSQQAEIEATTIPPTNDLESALRGNLAGEQCQLHGDRARKEQHDWDRSGGSVRSRPDGELEAG